MSEINPNLATNFSMLQDILSAIYICLLRAVLVYMLFNVKAVLWSMLTVCLCSIATWHSVRGDPIIWSVIFKRFTQWSNVFMVNESIMVISWKSSTSISHSDMILSLFVQMESLGLYRTSVMQDLIEGLCNRETSPFSYRTCNCWNKLLLKWVYEGVCPNFFIPQNNLFLSKVHGSAQRSLFQQLHGLYEKGLVCLLQSPSIRSSITDVLYNPRLSIYTDNDRIISECDIDVELFNSVFFSEMFHWPQRP